MARGWGDLVLLDVDRRHPLARTALGEQLPPYPGGDRRGTGTRDVHAFEAKAPAVEPAHNWLGRYRRRVLGLDVGVVVVAEVFTLLLGSRLGATVTGAALALATGLVVIWWAALVWGRCYEPRFLGAGTVEFQRVGAASLRLLAGIGLLCYAADIDVARWFLLGALTTGTVGLLLGRYGARILIHRERRRGRYGHRVLVLGEVAHIQDLTLELSRDAIAGMRVVGACIPGASPSWIQIQPDHHIPVVGSLSTVTDAIRLTKADTLAVTASPGISAEALRRLSYELEGSGVDLIVAPALMNVTGTRLSIRPVAGLPLLHVEEPELDGARVLAKGVFDRGVALLLLFAMAPFLVAIALTTRLTSPGPALFRQTRVGRNGGTFTLFKFRSMHTDAEKQRAALMSLNVYDGVLFKIPDDPRITRIGRVLRRYSLDELPQLLNVVRGEMSLVGPRPPLPSEVTEYVGHTKRRLLVKPGMTGLWQVSGRHNLDWENTVRLDLQYVETWSLGLDLSVLAKTFFAVARGTGV